jgi:H+/gluconate symporter-like permease
MERQYENVSPGLIIVAIVGIFIGVGGVVVVVVVVDCFEKRREEKRREEKRREEKRREEKRREEKRREENNTYNTYCVPAIPRLLRSNIHLPLSTHTLSSNSFSPSMCSLILHVHAPVYENLYWLVHNILRTTEKVFLVPPDNSHS